MRARGGRNARVQIRRGKIRRRNEEREEKKMNNIRITQYVNIRVGGGGVRGGGGKVGGNDAGGGGGGRAPCRNVTSPWQGGRDIHILRNGNGYVLQIFPLLPPPPRRPSGSRSRSPPAISRLRREFLIRAARGGLARPRTAAAQCGGISRASSLPSSLLH